MKVRVGYVKGEDGKLEQKLLKNDEIGKDPNVLYQVASQLGDYIITDEESIERTKKELLDRMFKTIRKVAELDEFWIVKELAAGKVTVAWKIDIPQLQGYYTWERAEELTKLLDETMAYL